MKPDMQTIRAIRSAGIHFAATVRAPGGYTTVELEPEQVATFLTDSDQAIADSMGVTKEQYQKWVEWDGAPQCGAKTSKGKRCKNYVSGGIQMTLRRWLEMEGDYCAVHGGEGSERR
ncbi:MAG: hypothetical protein Kow00114_33580 [Kiloniellaceae bacterium]